jgi:hypothetical protein
MTQLFVVSTAYGAMAAAAAIDEGLVASDGGERVLIAVNGAPVPELARVFSDSPHLRSVLARFDRIELLSDVIGHILPIAWEPRAQDHPMLERLLRIAWRIDDGPVELFLQSPQVAPATSLASIFAGSRICVLGDGLMTYGPLRSRMPWVMASRVTEVHYVDVVPGVTPVLFSDVGATATAIAPAAFARMLDEVSDAASDSQLDEWAASARPTALVLGQYLAALELVTVDEEERMQREMVERAAGLGAERVVFKAHPSAPPASVDGPRAAAEAHGVDFVVYSGSLPAEVVAKRLDAIAAVAGFSTALPTLAATLGVAVDSVGNAVLLERLDPFQNSNRVPIVLIDALTRTESPYRDPTQLQRLLDAVSYCMQPRQLAHLRDEAIEFLTDLHPSERDRYFEGRALTKAGLPHGAPRPVRVRVLDLAAGQARSRDLRDTYRAGVRRFAKAWRAFDAK